MQKHTWYGNEYNSSMDSMDSTYSKPGFNIIQNTWGAKKGNNFSTLYKLILQVLILTGWARNEKKGTGNRTPFYITATG